MPSSHLILCRPLLLLPPIPPSIRVFSSESTVHMRWPKYWSFSFNISPSNEHPGLISFRVDWLDLLTVQGTLKSLLQYHSSKASFLQCSAFFIVQLSHLYMTTGKTIALTRRTFVGSRAVIIFDNDWWHIIQPWCTPFPIWNHSVVPCPVLTVAFWPAYRFLKRQVRWSGTPISFRIFHSLLWSTQSKALA